ncbi:MAG: DUF3418 domain-containing protein, partial [Chitinivibrionales bacterium]|nr:DUF3418 domain-containing protein [Chitinivibrionales bacterium]
ECIRLYSKQDYESRPEFTTPEIRRTDLASVILTMSNLNLGRAENFPFVQRPAKKSLSDGYYRLRELGALNREGKITRLGKKMAAFPLDPPIARMLLYAQRHHALREICIIASALSIVDPRLERRENETGAETGHNNNCHPDSDFMSFVALWDSYRRKTKGKNGYRKSIQFCKQHGLSVVRMREWIDVYDQIVRIIHSMKGFRINTSPASYEAVHKSLLCGLMSTIAVRQENKLYRGSKEHDIMIFPGSVLFGKEPEWVLFHELVETRRLYGRTAAAIRPRWIEGLFAKRCTCTWKEPFFDPRTGTVKAYEQVTYKGLTLVKNRVVNYGLKRPSHAAELFIRQALVEEQLKAGYRFLQHNHMVREKIFGAQDKLRTRAYYAGDEALFDFYAERLSNVKSTREMSRKIARRGNDAFLCVDKTELLAEPLPDYQCDYPETIVIGTARVDVSYVFAPDAGDDGATVTIPLHLYNAVPLYYWEWLLPVFREERIRIFVRQVRKKVSDELPPAEEMAAKITSLLEPLPMPFLAALCTIVRQLYSIHVSANQINCAAFPDYLWVRVRVVDSKQRARDMFRLPQQKPNLPFPGLLKRPPFWAPHCSKWERTGLVNWDFGDVPATIMLSAGTQIVPLTGYMALCREEDTANLRVFFSRESAETSHREGVAFLLEKALEVELGWACGSFTAPIDLIRHCRDFTDKKELKKTINRYVAEFVLELPDHVPRRQEEFESLTRQASGRIPDAHSVICAWFDTLAAEYRNCIEILERFDKKYNDPRFSDIAGGLYDALDGYISYVFTPQCSVRFIEQASRYLRAFACRIEQAFEKPVTYRQSINVIADIRKEYRVLQQMPRTRFYWIKKELEELHFMIEELAVALFARQKVKTRFKVSENRVRKKIAEIEEILIIR